MQNKKTIVLLDFCGTLINFQTFDPYIKKVILSYAPKRKRWLNCSLILFISRIIHHFNKDYYFYKHYLVKLTYGIPETVFQQIAIQYCDKNLKPNIILETKDLIQQFREKNYEIIILSGGCDIYIKELTQYFNIKKVIATEILFKNGKSTGKIRNDCLGKNKVKLLKAFLGQSYLEQHNIIGITDSRSDLPMLDICTKKIIVSHNKHQPWVSADMDEIIWYEH